MVSKEKLNALGFASIAEYFNYILESKETGQKVQAKELYADLSKKQLDEFMNWFCLNNVDAADWIGLKKYLDPEPCFNVVKIFRRSQRREILKRGLTEKEAQGVVRRYPSSNMHMVVYESA